MDAILNRHKRPHETVPNNGHPSSKNAASPGSCSQWEIYDDYKRDIEAQKLQEQLNKKRTMASKKSKNQQDVKGVAEAEGDGRPAERGVCLRAAKVMERMTIQNVFDEFSMDLKYWNDGSDAFRPNDASLLPLWKFDDAQSAGKHVTSICFNSKHSDVFAVGYGSYASLEQTFGLISVYSLKNPAVPETNVLTESGVLSVAFHPEFPNLVAAGCYNGSVRIVDAKGEVLYEAVRHNEPIWQVFWKKDAGELQLFSASADGQLALWTFTRSEILFEPNMTIATQKKENGVAGLLALDFNQVSCSRLARLKSRQLEETTYLVGTEEGSIHRCSTEYDSEYLDTYQEHVLPVYGVKWNSFHGDVFLSSCEDWTVRLWDARSNRHSIMKFELNAPVADIAWAPYASTVFAAVTAAGASSFRQISLNVDAGHVFAFDVALNRHAAVCEQKIVNKGKLTTVLFHPTQPLLLIGDTNGVVSSLKLSPNLRKTVTNDPAKERERLERVLDIARKSVA